VRRVLCAQPRREHQATSESNERSLDADISGTSTSILASAQVAPAGHRALDSPSCARRLKALRLAPTARGAHARPSGLDAPARSSSVGNYAMAGGVRSRRTCGSELILFSLGAILRASAGAWHGTSSAFGSTDVERRRFGAYIGSNRRQPCPRVNRARTAIGAPERAIVIRCAEASRHGW
jgi:hypothetical protein